MTMPARGTRSTPEKTPETESVSLRPRSAQGSPAPNQAISTVQQLQTLVDDSPKVQKLKAMEGLTTEPDEKPINIEDRQSIANDVLIDRFGSEMGIAEPAPPVPAAPVAPAVESIASLLAQSEDRGGHLIARHIGKSTAELADRLVNEPRIPAASTFNSLAEAEAAVGGALQTNAQRIADWLGGGGRRPLAIDAAFSGGSVLARAAKATGVRVVLRGNGSGEWHVLTGFPTP